METRNVSKRQWYDQWAENSKDPSTGLQHNEKEPDPLTKK